jgi:hypothetical protein
LTGIPTIESTAPGIPGLSPVGSEVASSEYPEKLAARHQAWFPGMVLKLAAIAVDPLLTPAA